MEVAERGGRVKIECPECGFNREVNKDKLAGRPSVIAVCPQCGCRFRFSPGRGALGVLSPGKAAGVPEQAGEEEEDIRLVAKRAYEREASRFAPGPGSPEETPQFAARINPWACAPGETGWIKAFWRTAARAASAPRLFFAALSPDGGKQRAFLFYLAVCAIQSVAERFWHHVFYNYISERIAPDPQLEELLKILEPGSNIVPELLIRCGLLSIQLVVASLLMGLAYRLVAPGRGSCPLIFKIMAYSSAPWLLSVVPVAGSLAGFCWSLGCLALGCKTALDLNWPKTLFGFLPLLLLYGPTIIAAGALLGG